MPSDMVLELSLLCRCLFYRCSSSFLSSFSGSSLFSSLSCSFLCLGFLLGKSLSPSLVYFNLSICSSLGLVSSSLCKSLLLSLDLSIFLCFPVSEFLVSLLLCESSLGNTAFEVLLEENALIREDTTCNESRFSTYVKPSQCSFAVENDSSRVCVRVVRADLLNVTTIAR